MMYDLEKLGLGWYLRPHRRCFPAVQETRALQGAVNGTTGRGKFHSPSDSRGGQLPSDVEGSSALDFPLIHDALSQDQP